MMTRLWKRFEKWFFALFDRGMRKSLEKYDRETAKMYAHHRAEMAKVLTYLDYVEEMEERD